MINNKDMSLIDWLTVLVAIMPPTKILVAGAGSGNGSYLHWAHSNKIKNLILIEGESRAYKRLTDTWKEQPPGWDFLNLVIDNGSGENEFYISNISNENGLIRPDALQCLWSNISISKKYNCKPTLLEELSIFTEDTQKDNWLFIDFFSTPDILKESINDSINVLLIRVVAIDDALFKSDRLSYLERLTEFGYKVIKTEPERHSGVELWLCVKDIQNKTKYLEAEKIRLNNEISTLTSEVAKSNKENKNKSEVISDLKKDMDDLHKKMEDLNVSNIQLRDIESKIDALFCEQRKFMQQSISALGQHITRLNKK